MLATQHKLDLNIIESLLKDNTTTVNERNMDGWTALTWAVTNGCTKTVELLLAHGATVNRTITEMAEGQIGSAENTDKENAYTEIHKMLKKKLDQETEACN